MGIQKNPWCKLKQYIKSVMESISKKQAANADQQRKRKMMRYKTGGDKSYLSKVFNFFRYLIKDIKQKRLDKKNGNIVFKPYGLRMYCGRQGAGKTIGMVEQANAWHRKYPKALIVSNFDYVYADKVMTSLNDLLEIRNGTDGVIFLIDELQNEFSSAVSKDFPESLLSVITMQRKQRIVILATSQVFSRVAKPLREQCYEVVDCRTFVGRWTRCKIYDALDYIKFMDSKKQDDLKIKIRAKEKRSFVQDDFVRNCYDTYSVVRRMSRKGFVAKVWHDD